MPSTFKTPGAYVEEIVKFPPSVASVETAIPAFIGYTQKAEKNGESLKNIPVRITSFLEFVQYFGDPPPRDIIVRLNASNQYLKTERKDPAYFLYDSIRLFYDNGGGICFIVSVDDYSNPPEIGDETKGILGGLKALEKYDEPTLLLSPDAVSLDNDLYTFQVQAINQCNKLQDRFLICDLLKSDEKITGQTHDDRVAGFRDNIGINYLKYGAAYTPWLRTSLNPDLRFRDIIFALDGEVAPTAATSLALLTSITNNPSLLQLIYDLSNAVNAVDALKKNLVPGAGGGLVDTGIVDLDGQLRKLLKDYLEIYTNPAKTIYTDFEGTLQNIYQKIRDILLSLKVISDSLPVIVSALATPSTAQSVEFKLKNDIGKLMDQVKGILSIVVTHHREIFQKSTAGGAAINIIVPDTKLADVLSFAGFTGGIGNVPADPTVQSLYRTLTIKKVLWDFLKGIADDVSVTDAASALTSVITAIPVAGDLKAKVDQAITDAKTAAGVNSVLKAQNKLNTNLQAAATNLDKLVITIAKTFVDEDVALNTPANLAALTPVPPGLPATIVSALNKTLLDAIKAATIVAGSPGATKAMVVAALNFSSVLPKEYTLIASAMATIAGGASMVLYNTVLNAASNYESVFDQSLISTFGTYKTFVTKAGQELMILPPGSAVAGVYASVDSDRGVWKAPANTSLASVLGPLLILNAQDQESLNIDANAGKSINVIRAFTGKGTLVWGSRTLAGNDNEWRYVPVRRFFNYAEESIKKATEPFVFEPNDINTWIRVKAMIENFLTLEWRRGALAGAKATDAFYVKVGLGETMTSLDILEGRMIVEVGMAVVRPAEFIILRFAHKMQES